VGSGRGRERYGVVGRKVAAAVDAMADLIADLDADLVGGRDSVDLVAEWSRLEHLAAAALMSSARRVGQTDLWKRGGHRSAGHWLSHVTGLSVGEAVSLLETAEVVEQAPDTRDALSKGEVSPRQAKAIGRAEQADPDAGRRLLDGAGNRSTKETETEANRIVAGASSETSAEKAQRHHRSRKIWHAVDADGMGIGGWRLPIAEHTRLVSGLEAEQAAVFDENRLEGRREPAEAYAADAFCRILDRAFRSRSDGNAAGADGASIDEDWSFAKVIVKVDLAALDRGTIVPSEVCEVAGQGPIPVADVWRMIDGDAFVAAVSMKGTEISKVVHLGRRPTVLQRTALDWLGDGTCQIDGCTSKARLEIDHVTEWAATRRTEFAELARACGHHHDLKTHHGHRFGPLRPDGTRSLVPPGGVDPPGDIGPPDLRLLDGRAGARAPTDVPLSEGSRQGDLFDTG
jgi:hypothetical protein